MYLGGDRIKKLIIFVSSFVTFLTLFCFEIYADSETDMGLGVTYQTHIQSIGWQEGVADNETSGTTGQSLRVEGVKIYLKNVEGDMTLQYQAHVEKIGWQDWVNEGELAGTTGQAYRVEALKIMLKNAPAGYHIQYQVHVQSYGWQEWVEDGQVAGTVGESKRIEAIRIRIVHDSKIVDAIEINYNAHVQSVGWQDEVTNSNICGTTGRGLRIEAIKIMPEDLSQNISIRYQAHVQKIGWQDWVKDGEISGTTGKSLRMEAIKIELVNPPEGYHIEYQAHVQSIGWQEWVRDGDVAGTTGQALRLEALKIRIINDYDYSYTEYNLTLDDMLNIQKSKNAVIYKYDEELDKNTWQNATKDEIEQYVNPLNFTDDYSKYQFLILNYIPGITVEDVNKMLSNKGILNNKGDIFLKASLNENINPLYIVSHALHESGNGTSQLANGVLVSSVDGAEVEPRITYNIFGIGAYDNSAVKSGSEYAYKEGWFTIEDAIYGGIEWISKIYVNNPNYKQNTLYKMRWNPSNPGIHQYATDIGWAYKQISYIKELYDICSELKLYYDTPRYKN